MARYKARLGLAFALALLGGLFELARPWPIALLVDYVLVDQPLPSGPGGVDLPRFETPQQMIAWCVAAAIIIAVGGAAVSLAVLTVVVSVCQRLVYDLSRDLFDKLQRLSVSYHGRHHVGDLLQRVGGDVFVVHAAVSQVAIPATVSLFSLVGMFVIMAHLDLTLALFALAVVPLLVLALALFTRPMNDTTTHQYGSQGALMAFVEQSLSAMKLIQGFAREAYVAGKLEVRARELGEAYNVATRVSGGYNAATAAITGTAAALMLGLGAAQVLAGELTVGDLLVFLGYLTALYGPVSALSSSVGAAIAVRARGGRIFEILDSEEEVHEPLGAGATVLPRVKGDVVFENVTFGYPVADGSVARPVLRDVSFHARPGQITAIVGATGAGKTSLVSLLPRFYDPWDGRVLVDGHDVHELSLRSLRDKISLVFQEPYMFPMSIEENIAFGRPGATHDEIVAAARAARADPFIQRLPEGYATVVEPKGVSLSGGERQRIAIARAVLKNAPILILDEPTSALDARTEAEVFDALSSFMRDKTTFIISHRLTTIRQADQIVALEDGHIVEHGTHEMLLARGEVYAQLYKAQYIAAV
jgi:ABC-type multidrug transport system fused ATPase/permease subunit